MNISKSYLLKSYEIGEKHSEELEKIINKVNLKKENKVIDIGCGSGRNSLYLASLGLDVYSIDISKNALEKAKKKFNSAGYSIKSEIKEFTNLGFQDNYFDMLVSWRVFHIGNPETNKNAIQEAKRVLKKNGYAIIAVAAAHGKVYEKRLKLYGFSEKNTINYPSKNNLHKKHYFTDKEIPEFFEGFEIISKNIITEKSGHNQNKMHAYHAILMRKK